MPVCAAVTSNRRATRSSAAITSCTSAWMSSKAPMNPPRMGTMVSTPLTVPRTPPCQTTSSVKYSRASSAFAPLNTCSTKRRAVATRSMLLESATALSFRRVLGQRNYHFLRKQLSHLPAASLAMLVSASYVRSMARVKRLNPDEEALWRALMRIVLTLPRRLDSDLLRSTGLGASEYKVLMNLSEAQDRTLRMAVLADASGLSPRPPTRV